MTGVARVLRAQRPETKIVTTEPDGAALLSDGRAQERREDGSASGSHPAGPYMIQGWTPDFIPLVAQESIDKGYIDEVVPCRRIRLLPPRRPWRKRKAFFAASPVALRLPRLWMWRNVRHRLSDLVHAARYRGAIPVYTAIR